MPIHLYIVSIYMLKVQASARRMKLGVQGTVVVEPDGQRRRRSDPDYRDGQVRPATITGVHFGGSRVVLEE